MTRTSKTAIPTVAATGAGDHVKGANPEHDHDNAATDAAAVAAFAAALTAHVNEYHAPVVEPPPVEPPPVEPPPVGNSVKVASVRDLMAALANNSYDEIVVTNGRYFPANAGNGANNPNAVPTTCLWVGGAYAGRTNPVTVRAETKGGVIFDGQGRGSFGGITFSGGSHHQTWDGFSFDNGEATSTGVVVFGGYGTAGAHHITMKNITMLPGLRGHTAMNDHALYFSSGNPDGGHDLVFEDWDVQATGPTPLSSAYHHDHDPNCYNIRAERWKVKGTYTAVFFYADQKHDIVLKDWTIDGAKSVGVDLSHPSPNIRLENVQVANTPTKFYAPHGTAGLTKVNCNF